MREQINAYKGTPQRPWIRVRLVAANNVRQDVELLADTGNPCAMIIGSDLMSRFKLSEGPNLTTNFGDMSGGWVRVVIDELDFDARVLGYASKTVVDAARRSTPEFDGLAGLPLLRLVEFGGNARQFWLRQPFA
jgi:hypothetical protein